MQDLSRLLLVLLPVGACACGTTTIDYTTGEGGQGGEPGGKTTIAVNPGRHLLTEDVLELSSAERERRLLRVRTYECSGREPLISCEVDQNEVSVGGGAWLDPEDEEHAFLTGTYPDSDQLTGWVGSFASIEGTALSKLRVYAVGLTIEEMDRTALRQVIELKTQSSGTSQGSGVSLGVSDDAVLLGGGAEVHSSRGSLYLTASEPWQESGLLVSSFSPAEEDRGFVVGYVLGIRRRPLPGFSPLQGQVRHSTSHAASGSAEVRKELSSGWVRVGLGGSVDFEGQGRLLTGIAPGNGFSKSSSADALTPDGGDTRVVHVELRAADQ